MIMITPKHPYSCVKRTFKCEIKVSIEGHGHVYISPRAAAVHPEALFNVTTWVPFEHVHTNSIHLYQVLVHFLQKFDEVLLKYLPSTSLASGGRRPIRHRGRATWTANRTSPAQSRSANPRSQMARAGPALRFLVEQDISLLQFCHMVLLIRVL